MGHVPAYALHPEFPLKRTGCLQQTRVAEAGICISTGVANPSQSFIRDIQGENKVNERDTG